MKKIIFCTSLALTMTSVLFANIIAYEPYSSPAGTKTLDASTGTGWSGNWAKDPSAWGGGYDIAASDSQIIENSLSYVSGPNILLTSGNSMRITSPGAGSNVLLERPCTEAAKVVGTYWASYLVKSEAGNSAGNDMGLYPNFAGSDVDFFGSQNGKIYKINDTGSDDGDDIAWEVKSGRWNPYLQQGQKAHLGWIDFLVDVDATESFDVALYVDTDTTAWKTETITCDAVTDEDEMVMKRVYADVTGSFHEIKISNDASTNSPRIHAIIPYFIPGGLLY